jgi:hypothetical protein
MTKSIEGLHFKNVNVSRVANMKLDKNGNVIIVEPTEA